DAGRHPAELQPLSPAAVAAGPGRPATAGVPAAQRRANRPEPQTVDALAAGPAFRRALAAAAGKRRHPRPGPDQHAERPWRGPRSPARPGHGAGFLAGPGT